MDASSYFTGQGQQQGSYQGYQQHQNSQQGGYDYAQQNTYGQQQQGGYQQNAYGHSNIYAQRQQQYINQPPTNQQPKQHTRTASHISYGSHGSHTSMFECDLNAKDFFASTDGRGVSGTSSTTIIAGTDNNGGDTAGAGLSTTGAEMINSNAQNNNATIMASSNEDFSSYNNNANTAAVANEDFSNYNQSSNEEVYYEGVALQTALSAFGSVASAVGGMATNVGSNVRGVVTNTTPRGSNGVEGSDSGKGSGAMGGMMNALTPGRLANNMSNWRGKLAEVVAPQSDGQQQQKQHEDMEQKRKTVQMQGQYQQPPQMQGQSPMLQGQEPPPIHRQDSLPQGYADVQSQYQMQQQSISTQQQSSVQDVFGVAPPLIDQQMNQHTQQSQFNRQQSAQGVFTVPPVAPSPNSTSSWQMLNDQSNVHPPMQHPSPSNQRPPLSHQLSALEKAKHDSTTFQYADPLVGNLAEESTVTTRAALVAGAIQPPTEGVNSMEIGKHTIPSVTGEDHDAVVGEGQNGNLSDISAPPVMPLPSEDVFTSQQEVPHPEAVTPYTPMSLATTPSDTCMPPPAASDPTTATMKTTSIVPPKSIPLAPRSSNRRMPLNIPKKTNLPLPPPMPRKKHTLPTPKGSVPGTANSSLGGDSRSRASHLGSSSHFKKPPPMEVSAASPRLSTPGRTYSPRIDAKKLMDLSPLPSPRMEWNHDTADKAPTDPLDQYIDSEKPIDEQFESGTIGEQTKRAVVQTVKSGEQLPESAPRIISELQQYQLQEAMSSTENVTPTLLPRPVIQKSEKLEDWNIVASAVVRDALNDAVNIVTAKSSTENLPISDHPPLEDLAQQVTFSAATPPVYHTHVETESSRVTEFDVMSDYQSFVKDEDVPVIEIQEGLSQDDAAVSYPSVEANPEEKSHGAVLDSSMVAKCDSVDYQSKPKEEDINKTANNHALTEAQPAHTLPQDWVEGVDEASGQIYYYNTVTMESSWTVPAHQSPDPTDVSSGQVEDFNTKSPLDPINKYEAIVPEETTAEYVAPTGRTNDVPVDSHISHRKPDSEIEQRVDDTVLEKQASTKPSVRLTETMNGVKRAVINEFLSLGWTENVDESSGRTYYYNETTGESQWEKPLDIISSGKPAPSSDVPQSDESIEPHSEAVPVEMSSTAASEIVEVENIVGAHAETAPVETHSLPAAEGREEEETVDSFEEKSDDICDKKMMSDAETTEKEVMSTNCPSETSFLPEGWFEAKDPTGNIFFVCPATGVSSWTRPAAENKSQLECETLYKQIEEEPLEQLPVNEELQAEQNSNEEAVSMQDSDSNALMPPGWREDISEQTGKPFNYNEITNESRRDRPIETEDGNVTEEHEIEPESYAPVAPCNTEEVCAQQNKESAGTPASIPELETIPGVPASVSSGAAADFKKEEDRSPTEFDKSSITDDQNALPVGWHEVVDPASGKAYYYSEVTGETVWERPAAGINDHSEGAVDVTGTADAKDGCIPAIDNENAPLVEDVVPVTSLEPEIIISEQAVDGRLIEDQNEAMPLKEDASSAQNARSLPSGWQETLDPSSGNFYYFNEVTGVTSWTFPEEQANSDHQTREDEDASEPIKEGMTDEALQTEPARSEITAEESSPGAEEPKNAVDSSDAKKSLPQGWIASIDQTSGKMYYYNQETGESRWDLPTKSLPKGLVVTDEANAEPFESEDTLQEPIPSCLEPTQDSEIDILSKETDEVKEDENKSPSKYLPDGWAEAIDPTSEKSYYYNERTGEVSWTLPEKQQASLDLSADASSNAEEDEANDSTPIFKSSETADNLTSCASEDIVEERVAPNEPKLSDGWVTVVDESSGKPYYYNETSGETTWELPKKNKAVHKKALLASTALVKKIDHSRPAHAIACFGFGGKLCVMIPQLAKSLSGAALPSSSGDRSKTLRRGPIVIHQLRNLIPREHKYAIPAQLSLPMCQSRDEDVISFLDKKCTATDSLIWNTVRVAAKNGGRLKDDFNSVVELLLSSDEKESTAGPGSLPQSPKVPVSSCVNTDLEEIQKQLMRGNRDEAVDEALENKNYALALLIAGMSGFDTYQIVAQRFADEVLSPGSPLHTVALMLSKNLKLPSSNELVDPDLETFWCNDIYSDLVSTWKHQLASILSNHKEGWNKIVLTLGDRLMQLEQFDAAHVCYLMCGYPIGTISGLPTRLLLLGSDHNVPMHSELMTPESIESFLCTEAFEWARRKGNRRTCLQSLQTFKLRYAELLADFGHVDLAREYVVSIRQLTGLGLNENSGSQVPPMSGNALVIFPDDFVDRLYRFEDRLCVLIGAELSCKRKASEEHRKSAFAAITGGLGSVFSRKSSEEKDGSDSQQQENKLDEPSSENEFMTMIETKTSAVAPPSTKSTDESSEHDRVMSRKDPSSVSSKTAPPGTPKSPKPLEGKSSEFAPFNAPKPSTERKHDNTPFEAVPAGEIPPASAPPTLGDVADKVGDKPNEVKKKLSSPASTPNSKGADKKAPVSEPPRSGGWLSKLLGRDKESKAKVADVGEDMQAYYDEKLKRWIFPGDDPAEVAKPMAPPPIMTPKAPDDAPVVSNTPAVSNDPLAALMAPPSRVMSSKKSGPPSRRYADPLASMGNVSTPMTGLPPIPSTNVPESPMRTDAAPSAAAPPKFTVFQPKPEAKPNPDGK